MPTAIISARRNALWREHGPLCLLWRKGFRRDDHINYFLLLAAFTLHTVAMFKRGFSLQRLPGQQPLRSHPVHRLDHHGSLHRGRLMPRLRFVGAFASPLLFTMGVFALMPALDPPRGPAPAFVNGWISLHAALILLASALSARLRRALMFLSLERDLKANRVRQFFRCYHPSNALK